MIDSAERKEFVDAGCEFPVFNVRHPSVGDIIFPVVLFVCNLLTFLLYIAGGQSKALAQCLQALSGTGTRVACVHWRKSYAGDSLMSSEVILSAIHQIHLGCRKVSNWSQLRPL